MQRWRHWWHRLGPEGQEAAARTALEVLGLVLLTVGCGCVYWPLALIVPGALLTGAALLGARR